MHLLALLRRPDVAPLLAAATLGRIPLGMVPLALVLFARGAGLDFGAAGSLAAAWSLGLAVGTPVLGRGADRRGPAPVLLASGVAGAAALAALTVLPGASAAGVVVAALAGLATPPLEPALRMLWPTLVERDQLERAYALDAAIQEVIFVVGPLLVAAAVLVRADAGLLLAATLVLTGTVWTAALGVVRRRRPGNRGVRHWAGPLSAPALVALYAAIAVVGALVGMLPVVATAYAESLGTEALAALLVGANGLGALVGGVAVAVRPTLVPRRIPPHLRLPLLVAVLAAAYLPLAVVPALSGADAALVGAAAVSGLPLPALLTACYLDVDRLAPTGTVAEAFGWIITAFLLGSSAGAAVAGVLARQGRPGWAFAAGIAAVLAAAGVVVTRRRSRLPVGRSGA
ncbi:MAG TPA: MFS transporter [Kineosporiaceae bacterium]|nr:MFS transporter [Kineosporiaceae bacterium]